MNNEIEAMDFERFLMRPAVASDIDAIERLANASAFGITTLPTDRAELQARIQRSLQAFASEDAPSGGEIYLFVLEDREVGRIVGTSGIAAAAGAGRHFYSYRNEYIVHSATNATQTRIHTLNLCQDLTGATLLTSFYIEPGYETSVASQLLSRGRLLFIAQFPERFAERIAAESPGLADDVGQCPFWEAVGQRFFGLSYPEAERIAVGRTKDFIGQLLPQSPLYVALLPQSAQWAIGQLHPVAELPFSILQDEGFDADTYVDIFDAGPIVDAKVAGLRTVASSRVARIKARAGKGTPDRGAPGVLHLMASTRRDVFRAVVGMLGETSMDVDARSGHRLGLQEHGSVRVAPIEYMPGEGRTYD